ncbi:MAG: glycoside hydrolase family 76 protein [Acidobacteria bacterium]|nr:glycoside hydrolase family 76 protein [Acidobacteriota bacterium]
MVLRRCVSLLLCAVTSAACTAQISPKEARHRAEQGVEALQQWYNPATGLYNTTGWWNSANALTAITDYMSASGSKKYAGVLANTYTRAQVEVRRELRADPKKDMTGFPGFLNKYYDDEGWWALAWIDAYDLTRDVRYLAMARSIFDDMAGGWDQTCGGGVWWSKDRKYKNAIANELFLSVAAHLAMRGPAGERERYAAWAAKQWQWFRGSGMINGDNLINDGLTIDAASGTCTNNKKTVWTYNQGVVLGGLAEWSKRPGNAAVLDDAKRIAGAALTHLTDKDGILHDPCEPKCGADGIQFKGIFMRNLGELNAVSPDARYSKSFAVNANSIWTKDRTPQNTFGTVWSGPVTTPDAGTQSSALDALVAAQPGEQVAGQLEYLRPPGQAVILQLRSE